MAFEENAYGNVRSFRYNEMCKQFSSFNFILLTIRWIDSLFNHCVHMRPRHELKLDESKM